MQPHYLPALTRRLDFAAAPLPLFRALTGNGAAPHTVLLESAEPESRRHRRSLLVVSAALMLTCRGADIEVEALRPEARALLPLLRAALPAFAPRIESDDRLRCSVPRQVADDTDHERLRRPSSLDVVRTLVRVFQPERRDLPESVLVTGLFSYDLVEQFETLPPAEGSDNPTPHYRLYLADRVVLIDHLAQRTELVAVVIGADEDGAFEAARADIAAMESTVAGLDAEGRADAAPEEATPGSEDAVSVDLDDEAFGRLVTRLKGHITRGDVFQIVPSRTFTLPCPDPLAAYQALRRLEPSPYLFYLNAGDFTLFGASPESAVRVDGPARTVELSPVAGTRPRGLDATGAIDPDLDSRLEAELRLDPKENAEHMMLVDLARNDVARISAPGTRRVHDLLRVERFGRVMHLVSRVGGELAPGLDALHACQACFNMGTLTGAPKLRAMELLREHETSARGHYGGALGYLQGDGSLDTAIVIRAALIRDGVAQVRAGAGVVHDSVPEREADETRRKASVVLRAIAHANDAAVLHA